MPDLFFNNVLNRTYCSATTTKGSTASVTGAIVSLSTGTAANSSATLNGLLPLYLNQEEHTNVTVSSSFTSNRIGTRQFVGMGDAENGAFFGFIDAQFGIYITRMGSRQYWQVIVTQGATQTGQVTLQLQSQQIFTFTVGAGQTAMQIMQQVAYSSDLSEANLRCFMGTDRVIIVSSECDAVGAGSFDAGSTGVVGTCTVAAASRPATRTEWIPANNFNRNIEVVPRTDLTTLNIYQIKFSKVCTGTIEFSIFDRTISVMVLLHSWTPDDFNGFNTSISYLPTIQVRTQTGQAAPCKLLTSMASISSGTPSPTAMHTAYSKTWSLDALNLQAGVNSIVSVLLNPVVNNESRNTLICSVTHLSISSDCTTPLRALLLLNGAADTSLATQSHLPWNAMRYAPSPSGSVNYGYPMGNVFMKPGAADISQSFDAFLMVPGSVFAIGLTVGNNAATALCNHLDITISWNEY